METRRYFFFFFFFFFFHSATRSFVSASDRDYFVVAKLSRNFLFALLRLLFSNRVEGLDFCAETLFVIARIALACIYKSSCLSPLSREFSFLRFSLFSFLPPPHPPTHSVVVLRSVSFPPRGSFCVHTFTEVHPLFAFRSTVVPTNEIQRRVFSIVERVGRAAFFFSSRIPFCLITPL